MRKDEITKALHSRFAVKKYNKNKHIKNEDFDLILEAAHLSPSSFGLEPWKILVVENKELMEKLKPVAWGALNSFEGADRFVIILSRKNVTAESAYFEHFFKDVKKFDDENFSRVQATFKNFQENEFALTHTKSGVDEWAARQCYIPLANMIYTASLLGIDSCPIEGFHKKNTANVLAAYVSSIDEYNVACMVSFGYHEGDINPKTRRDIRDVIEVL